MTPLVSIITVNFKQPEVTCELLRSLKSVEEKNFEVIVVENGSGDNSANIIQKEFPEIKLIKSEKNLGFAGGNNLGMKHACGDYFLFVNNDTEIESGFIDEMLKTFEISGNIGAVSPKIVFNDPKDVIQYAGALSINPYTGRGKKIGNGEYDNGQYDEIRETELGHGAALMVPRRVVEIVGGMPELYFLYYEEHDWCENIKRAGFKLYYNGLAKIKHKESVSVGKSNPLKVYYMNRNRLIYCRRNSGSLTTKLSSFIFYFTFAFPKGLMSFLFRRKFLYLKAMIRGAWEGISYTEVNKKYPVDLSLLVSKFTPA